MLGRHVKNVANSAGPNPLYVISSKMAADQSSGLNKAVRIAWNA